MTKPPLLRRSLIGLAFFLIIGSLMFFGLAPMLVDDLMNPVSPEPLVDLPESSQRLHQGLFVADLHADSLLWGRDLSRGYHRGQLDLPRLQAGNVALQAFSVVTQSPRGLNVDRNDRDSDTIFWLGIVQGWPPAALRHLTDRALLQAEQLRETAERSDGRLRIIRSRSDLQQFLADRTQDPSLVAGWLTLEGSHALEGQLEHLDRLAAAGFRMLAPTHFFDNEIAGSAHGFDKGGLTTLGREWVRRMEARELIIDLAHASTQTMEEVLGMATRPIVVSHTGVRGTCDNNRNLSDDHLRRIAATGGLIGIGFWDTAVCDTSVAAIVRAIRYTTDLVGVTHLALGSDFDGAVKTPFDASQLGQLTHALRQAGFSDVEMAGIMGGNIRDFLLRNLPAGDPAAP